MGIMQRMMNWLIELLTPRPRLNVFPKHLEKDFECKLTFSSLCMSPVIMRQFSDSESDACEILLAINAHNWPTANSRVMKEFHVFHSR